MAGSSSGFEALFAFEKATKITYKCGEQPESGQTPRIGSLYVQKWALGKEPPKRIQVTVRALQ